LAIAALTVWAIGVPQAAGQEGPPTQSGQLVSVPPDTTSEEVALRYLAPAIRAHASAGLIEYRGVGCRSEGYDTIPFPLTDIHPSPNEQASAGSVHELIRGDHDVIVDETIHGFSKIEFGDLPPNILKTRIARLKVPYRDQFDPNLVWASITDSPEVRAAEGRLGTMDPRQIVDMLVQEPRPGAPHFPASLTDITVEDALDVDAKTFNGIVVFGACEKPLFYEIGFFPLDFDTTFQLRHQ
jgi:hypothetical protein